MRHTIEKDGERQVVGDLAGHDDWTVVASETGKVETLTEDHVFDEKSGKWSKDAKRAATRKRRADRRADRSDRELLDEALDRIEALEALLKSTDR